MTRTGRAAPHGIRDWDRLGQGPHNQCKTRTSTLACSACSRPSLAYTCSGHREPHATSVCGAPCRVRITSTFAASGAGAYAADPPAQGQICRPHRRRSAMPRRQRAAAIGCWCRLPQPAGRQPSTRPLPAACRARSAALLLRRCPSAPRRPAGSAAPVTTRVGSAAPETPSATGVGSAGRASRSARRCSGRGAATAARCRPARAASLAAAAPPCRRRPRLGGGRASGVTPR